MNTIKKLLCAALALLLLGAPALAEELPAFGVCIYDGTDTFMASLRLHLETYAQGKARLTVYDSRNDQNLQNDQVEGMLEAGADVLIINPVDRLAAGYLIEKARKRQTPVLFVNKEPLEDLLLYEHAFYVGADGAQSGRLSGEILAEYFLAHPEADKNGDGTVQYVLIKGEPGHQDAELRTQNALKPLQEAGFRVEKLQEDTGMWRRQLGQEKMAGFLLAWGDQIECVIANNDEMALGAINALKAAGYFSGGRFMPVVGVDAISQAIEALRQGSLLGTVFNDGEQQAMAAVDLAILLAKGEEITADTYAYPISGERFVWIPYQRITREELTDP